MDDKDKVPQWLMPDWLYNSLKWLGLIVCPALATFILAVGGAFGWDGTQAAAVVVTALGTFIGACIGISAKGGGDGA